MRAERGLTLQFIKHPEQVNAALADRVDMMGVTKTNATRRAARLAVLDHEGCVEFDFASYFDQFPLSEGVAEYFAFTNGHGTYVPRRMPMGASFAVAVATAATRILVYGVGEGLRVTIAHQIDNVRIAGPEDDCRLAALRFIDRCRQAGVTLNDFNLPTLYGRVNDFMGDVAKQRFGNRASHALGEIGERCAFDQLHHQVRLLARSDR